MNRKILVAYFSASGATAKAAEKLARKYGVVILGGGDHAIP